MSQMLDIRALCAKLGGTRPIHPATVHRKIKNGQLPSPIKLGRIARWDEREVDALLQRLADARGDNPQPEKTS